MVRQSLTPAGRTQVVDRRDVNQDVHIASDNVKVYTRRARLVPGHPATIRLPKGTGSACRTPNYRDANNLQNVPKFQLGGRSHLAR